MRLVSREGFAAEGRAMGVEGHAQMGGLLFADDFVERIDEADDGRRVQTLGVDAGVLDEGVIRAIDERVGV